MTSATSDARGSGDLPHPITFYLTARQRDAVLRRLNRHDADRTRALLSALRVAPRCDRRGKGAR